MENKIEELINNLCGKDGIQRQKARHELIEIGVPAVEYLIELLDSPKEHIRWEAIKTLSQIAAPESVPVLIKALENDDFDVRWLAAEGLIEIGKSTVKPLMKTLINNQNSKYLLEGIHHILKGLEFKHLFTDDYGIIKKIENYSLHPEIVLAAEEILVKYNIK